MLVSLRLNYHADNRQMLVKWALEGRRKTAKSIVAHTNDDRHGLAMKSTPASDANLSAVKDNRLATPSSDSETTAQALTSRLDRLHYQSHAAFARTTEDEGDRAVRRIHAEERDTNLRNEKLLSLVEPQPMRHINPQGIETEPTMPLTEENMEKFAHEHDNESPLTRTTSSQEGRSTNNGSPRGSKAQHLSRPALSDTRQNESELTITERTGR